MGIMVMGHAGFCPSAVVVVVVVVIVIVIVVVAVKVQGT